MPCHLGQPVSASFIMVVYYGIFRSRPGQGTIGLGPRAGQSIQDPGLGPAQSLLGPGLWPGQAPLNSRLHPGSGLPLDHGRNHLSTLRWAGFCACRYYTNERKSCIISKNDDFHTTSVSLFIFQSRN